jgi:hypothetical protein
MMAFIKRIGFANIRNRIDSYKKIIAGFKTKFFKMFQNPFVLKNVQQAATLSNCYMLFTVAGFSCSLTPFN